MSRMNYPFDADQMADDMAELLRTLGLGDHARPVSPHRVMVEEITPAVGRLVSLARALKYTPDLRGAEAERAILALRERSVWALGLSQPYVPSSAEKRPESVWRRLMGWHCGLDG